MQKISDRPSPAPLSRWSVIGVLTLAHAVGMLQRSSLSVVRVELSADFMLSATQFGLAASMYFYAYTIGQIPMGYSVDHAGPRLTSSVAFLFVGLGAIVSSLTHDLTLLYVGRFVMGLAGAAIFVSLMKAQSVWFHPNEFATVSGIVALFTNLGALTAQYPLAFLVSLVHWRVIFSGIALFSLLVAWNIWKYVRDRPDGPSFGPASIDEKEKPHLPRELRQILKAPGMPAALAAYCLTQGPYMALSAVWGVSYVMEIYGKDAVFASLLTGCLILGMMGGGILIGCLSDRWGRRRPLLAMTSLLHLAGWLVLLGVDNLPIWAVFASFLGIGLANSSAVLYWTVMKELGPPKSTGLVIAIGNTASFLSSALCTYAIGVLLDFFGNLGVLARYQRAFWMCAALVALSLLVLFFLPETGAGARRNRTGKASA
jgi:MFS family permease